MPTNGLHYISREPFGFQSFVDLEAVDGSVGEGLGLLTLQLLALPASATQASWSWALKAGPSPKPNGGQFSTCVCWPDGWLAQLLPTEKVGLSAPGTVGSDADLAGSWEEPGTNGLQCSAAGSQGAAWSSAGFTGSPTLRRSLCLGSPQWGTRVGR